jgi:hypothetical protein
VPARSVYILTSRTPNYITTIDGACPGDTSAAQVDYIYISVLLATPLTGDVAGFAPYMGYAPVFVLISK